MGSCKHGNGSSKSTEDRDLLKQLSDCQRLKKSPTTWNNPVNSE
jgi:hypothetical protein